MSTQPMAPRPTREWTLMFYLASDNPLAPSIVSQLKSLKAAGFHADANVIARFDPFVPNTPSHIYEVNVIEKIEAKLRDKDGRDVSNIGFNPSNDPFVRNLVLDKVWDEDDPDGIEVRDIITNYLEEHRNGSDVPVPPLPTLPKGKFFDGQTPRESLAEFLNFCREQYPARRYMLFILGHGVAVGNDIFLFDSDADGRPGANGAAAAASASASRNGKNNGGGAEVTSEVTGEKEGRGEPGQEEKRDPEPDLRSSLTLRQLGRVLGDFREALRNQETKSEFELVGFHSCSMSGVEVAYELQDTANFMLASQGPAFVGSWPYRQMLLRIFNDINAMIMPGDLAEGPLLSMMAGDAEGPAAFLRGKLSEETAKKLREHDGRRRPDPDLLKTIVRELKKDLGRRDLSEDEDFMRVAAAAGLARPSVLTEAKSTRAQLAELFGGKMRERSMDNPRNVKDMVTKLFYYVLYNSFDFQLAGYSFDLCLCDLRKVKGPQDPKADDLQDRKAEGLKTPLDNLAKALIEGLKGGPGLADDAEPLVRELILLAHWDAQSFFQENYTDLYDFCFRLKRRCEHIFDWLKTPNTVRANIIKACEGMMNFLEKGAPGDDDRFVVRAEFVGPEHQYSHGLSIYFPWSAPRDGFFRDRYVNYKLVKETAWGDFLQKYFDNTLRETFDQEEAVRLGDPALVARAEYEQSPDEQVLTLLERVSTRLFGSVQVVSSDATLDGPGPGKTSDQDSAGPGGGKTSDQDSSGAGCGCASIKNYPSVTRSPRADVEEGTAKKVAESRPMSRGVSRAYMITRRAGD